MVIVKCKGCGKEYELVNGENPSNYQCECGGNLIFDDKLDDYGNSQKIKKTEVCLDCGTKNPEKALYCQECGHKLLPVTKQKSREIKPVKIVPDLNPFWWIFLNIFVSPLIVILIGFYFVFRKTLGGWLIVGYGFVGEVVSLITVVILYIVGFTLS